MSGPWEDFAQGGTATSAGPWEEFKGKKPWEDFGGDAQKMSMTQRLASLPGQGLTVLGQGIQKVKQMAEPLLQPLMDMFREDPGQGSIPPSSRRFAEATETYGPPQFGVVLPGYGLGVVPVNMTVPQGVLGSETQKVPRTQIEELHPAVQALAYGVGKPLQFASEQINPLNATLAALTGGSGPALPTVMKALGIAFGVPIAAQAIPEQAGVASVQPTPENVGNLALSTLLLGAIGKGVSEPARTFTADTGIRPNLNISKPGVEVKTSELPTVKLQVPMEKSGLTDTDIGLTAATQVALAKPEFQDLRFGETPGYQGPPPLVGLRPVEMVEHPDARFQKPYVEPQRIVPPGPEARPGSLVLPELPPGIKQAPLEGQLRALERIPEEPPSQVTGPSAPYRPPSPPPTPEQYRAKQERANVEWGLTMPSIPPESPLRGRVGSGIQVDDFDAYQEAQRLMLTAYREGRQDEFLKRFQEAEDIKNRQPVPGMPPVAPQGKAALRPAINIGGRILKGNAGESHADILQRNGINPDMVPHEDMRRGFIDITKPDQFLDRRTAEKQAGVVGTAKAGGLDSQDLVEGGANAVRELRTSSISETQPSRDIQKVEEEVRRGAETAREVQEKEKVGEKGGATFYSGMPLRLEKDRPKGDLEGFWMHFAGHLLPETEDYQLAREVVDEEPKATPAARQISDEGAKRLEQDMQQKGFTKVIRQGDTYFVDNNASLQQLTGIRNQAKAEGRKVQTMNLYSGVPLEKQDISKFAMTASRALRDRPTNLYAGLNPFKSDIFRAVLDRFYARGVKRTPEEALTHFVEKHTGTTAPAHVAANQGLANKIIEFASADVSRQFDPTLGQTYKDRIFKDLVEEGIRLGEYKYAQQGQPSTIAGQPTQAFEIRAPGIGHKTLLVKKNLAEEFSQALHGGKRMAHVGMQVLLDIATEAQVTGLTDVTAHFGNMYASMVKSPGKSPNFAVDQALRSIPKYIDPAIRIAYELYRHYTDDPTIQAQMVKISKLGAARPIAKYPTLLSKAASKVADVIAGPDVAKKVEEFTNFSYLIRVADAAGRRARDRMFDNLVKQGVPDTPFNRREFINAMGQYNPKLMSEWQEIMQANLSQFIVAGRRFNRNAIQTVLGTPEFRSQFPVAAAKARMSNILSLVSTGVIFPIVMNYFLTGKFLGRPGTPVGKIDTGKDDPVTGQHITFDPMKLDLARRGLRGLGVEAGLEGLREGKSAEEIAWKAASDFINFNLHPFEGPPIRIIEAFKEGGRGTSPKERFENAAMAINPMVKAYLTESDTGEKGGAKAMLVDQPLSVIGVGKGKFPSQTEKVEQVANRKIEDLSLEERILAQKKVRSERPPLTEEAQAKIAGRAIENEARRGTEMKATFDKPTRQWMDSRKLILPGYDNKIDFGKTKLYLTTEESKRLDALVKQEYMRSIEALKSDSEFEDLPTQERQEVFHRVMSEAAHRARGLMKEELDKTHPSSGNAQELNKTPRRRRHYRVLE